MTRRTRALDPEMCRAIVASDRWRASVRESEGGCLVWTRATRNGYGVITTGSIQLLVHRVALAASLGRDLIAGMDVDHLCHNWAIHRGLTCEPGQCQHRACVNPEHLAEVTHRANILAGGTIVAAEASRQTCRRGHPLAPSPSPSRSHMRECATCRRARELRRLSKGAA